MGRIKEQTNTFILNKLIQVGFKDVAPSHGDILSVLLYNEELTMTDISNKIHRDRSTVTCLVNKLTSLGYISTKKDLADSRVTIVCLTEKGKALKPAFEDISAALFATEYDGIEEEDMKVFRAVLEKIHANFTRNNV